MQNIRHLVEEIRELGAEATHRSALRIHQLLDNNRRLFLTHVEADDFAHLLRLFAAIADTPARDFGSELYRENYQRSVGLLLFHLGKIL